LLDVRLCPADVTEQFGAVDPPVKRSGKGGRPAAPWWDDLWIEICRQVYRGEVMPDQQVNIEKAMHAWISAHGYEAGETTVRDRARRLFKALNREDGN
jgi:hypothetical protein